MSEQLERIEKSSVNDPVIQEIIDEHLEEINAPWKLILGRRFQAEPGDPHAFSRGIYVCRVPLGVVYVSDQLYSSLNREELRYIVFHEVYHILNNDSAANFVYELESLGFSNLVSEWTRLEPEEAQEVLEGVRAVLEDFESSFRMGSVGRSRELGADRYAVIWASGKENAISALKKLAEMGVDGLSHIGRDGRFEPPALTIEERIRTIEEQP
ncbi:MAG: M48 family metalloprotease [Candidatus Freyarchaeota archaeon]